MEDKYVFDVDVAAAARNLARRRRARTAERKRLLARATADAERIIDLIASRYLPTRIWQWGSLVHTNRFSEISDIDVAVEGITSEETLSELRGVVENMTDFHVDLVAMERIDKGRANLIREFGRMAWEQKRG